MSAWVGVLPDKLTAQQIQAAGERSLHFVLTDWMNQGFHLWTVEQGLLALHPGQNTYALPQTISEIKEMNLRMSIRALGGTASSSSGHAANAFDINPHTACVQDVPS